MLELKVFSSSTSSYPVPNETQPVPVGPLREIVAFAAVRLKNRQIEGRTIFIECGEWTGRVGLLDKSGRYQEISGGPGDLHCKIRI